MGRLLLWTPAMILVANVLVAAAQADAPTMDTIRMTNVITKRTGVVVLAAVRPRDKVDKAKVYDVEVRFGGPVKDYRGAMNAIVAAVGEATRQAAYQTEWCYIITHERGRERILISDIRHTQTLGLDGKRDEAWTYFDSKKTTVK